MLEILPFFFVEICNVQCIYTIGRNTCQHYMYHPINFTVYWPFVLSLLFQYNLCCKSGILYNLLHIVIGGVCLLAVLVTIVISERDLVHFVTTQLWGRKIGKTNWEDRSNHDNVKYTLFYNIQGTLDLCITCIINVGVRHFYISFVFFKQ